MLYKDMYWLINKYIYLSTAYFTEINEWMNEWDWTDLAVCADQCRGTCRPTWRLAGRDVGSGCIREHGVREQWTNLQAAGCVLACVVHTSHTDRREIPYTHRRNTNTLWLIHIGIEVNKKSHLTFCGLRQTQTWRRCCVGIKVDFLLPAPRWRQKVDNGAGNKKSTAIKSRLWCQSGRDLGTAVIIRAPADEWSPIGRQTCSTCNCMSVNITWLS